MLSLLISFSASGNETLFLGNSSLLDIENACYDSLFQVDAL
jgi:hypothetical protein